MCRFDTVPMLCSWKCTVPSGDGTSVIKDLQRQECEPLFWFAPEDLWTLRWRCASAACLNKILICGKRNNKWKRIWSVCPQSWWNASALQRLVSFRHSSRHSFSFGKNTFVRTWTWLFRQVCLLGRGETRTGWHLWCCVTCRAPTGSNSGVLVTWSLSALITSSKHAPPNTESVLIILFFSSRERLQSFCGQKFLLLFFICFMGCLSWPPSPPCEVTSEACLRGWPLADQALPVFPSLSAHRPFISAAPRAQLFILSDSD